MLAPAVCPLVRIDDMAARAVNDRPYKAILFCVWHFRQVCRGRIVASRAVCPIVRIDGTAARAVNDRPYRWYAQRFVCAAGTNSTLFIIFYLLSFI